MDWLNDFWGSLTFEWILFWLAIFVISLAVSFILIGVVMVRLPSDYFSSHYVRSFLPDSPWHLRWSAIAVKNAVGVLLVIAGILLSLPGIPGQGVLTILLGLIMLDIPGKRPIEARIIRQPAILAAVNKLRSKYGRPQFQVD